MTRPNESKGFEPTKARKIGAAETYVLSLLGDGRWIIVDHYHADEIRYPGRSPMEAMTDSAEARGRFCERRNLEPGVFLAVAHADLGDYGIDPATRITPNADGSTRWTLPSVDPPIA